MITKICKTCGKEFLIFPFRINSVKFCSRKCYMNWRFDKKHPERHPRFKNASIVRQCLICKKEFVAWKINKRKYCSQKCANKSKIGKPTWNKNTKGLCKAWNKNKTLEQLFGNEKALKLRKEQSERMKERHRKEKGFGFQKGHTEYRTKECLKKMGGKLKIHFQSKRKSKICPICKKEFWVSQFHINKIYCSRQCMLADWNTISKKIAKANTNNPKKIKADKKRWQDSIYRDKQIKAIIKGSLIKPNKPETYLTNFLNKILPNEYKYVGDGQFVLGGKCPDFLNTNGKKKLIELYGDYWHRNDDPQDRINYFKKFGFDTLVIWQSELNDKFLRDRILSFNKSLL